LRAAKSLKQLHISKAKDFSAIANAMCHNTTVHDLNLTGIYPDSILAMLEQNQALEHLNLSNCPFGAHFCRSGLHPRTTVIEELGAGLAKNRSLLHLDLHPVNLAPDQVPSTECDTRDSESEGNPSIDLPFAREGLIVLL
jgi:hypothetical protein